MTDFDMKVLKGKSKGMFAFGAKTERFHYISTKNKHGTVGPANY